MAPTKKTQGKTPEEIAARAHEVRAYWLHLRAMSGSDRSTEDNNRLARLDAVDGLDHMLHALERGGAGSTSDQPVGKVGWDPKWETSQQSFVSSLTWIKTWYRALPHDQKDPDDAQDPETAHATPGERLEAALAAGECMTPMRQGAKEGVSGPVCIPPLELTADSSADRAQETGTADTHGRSEPAGTCPTLVGGSIIRLGPYGNTMSGSSLAPRDTGGSQLWSHSTNLEGQGFTTQAPSFTDLKSKGKIPIDADRWLATSLASNLSLRASEPPPPGTVGAGARSLPSSTTPRQAAPSPPENGEHPGVVTTAEKRQDLPPDFLRFLRERHVQRKNQRESQNQRQSQQLAFTALSSPDVISWVQDKSNIAGDPASEWMP